MSILSLDGGGTRTLAGLYSESGELLGEGRGGPCNPVAYGVKQSLHGLLEAARQALKLQPAPALAAIAVAGALDPAHREALGRRLCEELDIPRALVATDVHTTLWANTRGGEGILAIAGTGSSVLAQDASGKLLRAGGRGTIFGDQGSAYAIATAALRAAARAVDDVGLRTLLTEALPAAAGVDDFEVLVGWSARAPKRDLAQLAITVSACAEQGDQVAREIIENQALRLASVVRAAHLRQGLSASAPVWMHGGLFRHLHHFREHFVQMLAPLHCQETIAEGHAAARALAEFSETPPHELPPWLTRVDHLAALELPPTEQVSPGPPLDTLSEQQIIERMCTAEEEVVEALRHAAPELAQAVKYAGEAMRSGGRIIYLGAGTSGRLGVLDASECPPTFGLPPERVVGIMAGGDVALRDSVEGAEDDAALGAAEVLKQQPGACDFVVGIAASGTTPFVHGGLRAAKTAGAKTALLCCNPRVAKTTSFGTPGSVPALGSPGSVPAFGTPGSVPAFGPPGSDPAPVLASLDPPLTLTLSPAKPGARGPEAQNLAAPPTPPAAPSNPFEGGLPYLDLLIILDTGPEVLAGSTRLKAGSATKAALNMISTGAMARSGNMHQGLMVGMIPSNTKLKARAIRIVQALTQLPPDECLQRLEAADWDIRKAAGLQ